MDHAARHAARWQHRRPSGDRGRAQRQPAATAVRLEAHGVTAREREIAGCLAAGLTNSEIAERLVLSPYTVQDHIKSLLEKTNVSSRQELVARIFLDDYLPRIAAGAPLDSTGQFTRG
ncbi:MAG: helix-turn-helix domain-containing protein [Solirubrobacteraceae bacterium]